MLVEPRTRHPFHVYDAMTMQPPTWTDVINCVRSFAGQSEAMLHGPFQCAEPEDLFLLLAPAGTAQKRLFPLVAMIKDIGASSVGKRRQYYGSTIERNAKRQ